MFIRKLTNVCLFVLCLGTLSGAVGCGSASATDGTVMSPTDMAELLSLDAQAQGIEKTAVTEDALIRTGGTKPGTITPYVCGPGGCSCRGYDDCINMFNGGCASFGSAVCGGSATVPVCACY